MGAAIAEDTAAMKATEMTVDVEGIMETLVGLYKN